MDEAPAIVKADKATRRRGLILAVAGLLAGFIGLRVCQMFLANANLLSRTDPQQALRQVETVFFVLIAGLAASVLAFAAWLVNTARRTTRSGQYPPPGMKVVSDTPLLTGDRARRRATAALILAGVLVALAICLVLWGWRSAGFLG